MMAVKFEAKHYHNMKRPEGMGLERWTDDVAPYLKQMEASHTMRTLTEHGRCYGIMGLVYLWDGVCEVIFIPSNHLPDRKIAVLKMVRKYLLEAQGMFHRVQLTCLDVEKFRKFAEFFGFKPDGVMHNYDRHKNDYVMYSLTGGEA